jgi:hypothetical protein
MDYVASADRIGRLMWRFRSCDLSVLLLLATQAAALSQSAHDPAGYWNGSYTCLQGRTALHLTIKRQADGTFRGLFHFGSLPPYHPVPEGCFLMSGVFDPATRRLTLTPGKWFLQPDGFVTVGLDGVVSPSGSTFTGNLQGGYQCTTFDLPSNRI